MNTRVRQLLYVLIALVVALIVSYLAVSFLEDVITHPELYFTEAPTTDEVASLILLVAALVQSILIAVIVYLVFAGRTRATLAGQKMTRELALSGEFFRRLYDHAPTPYMLVSPRGVTSKPNRAALRLFGTTDAELVGGDVFSFVSEDSKDNAALLREKLWRHIPIDREELQVARADGTTRWVLFSIFRFKHPGSKEHSGLATLVDITEQKQLELAKTEFVSLASHQLRTPLAAMKWHSDLLLSGDIGTLPEKQEHYIQKIHRNNEVMIDLVDVLLNISRLEVGKLEPNREQTDAIKLARSVIEEMVPLIQEKGIVFEHRLDDAFASIQSDPKLLRIVIQNLLSNAIKYTPSRGAVRLLLERTGGEKRIVVSDTGIGIPIDAQDKIFTKMYRTENAKKVDTKGTGLGLYLVKSIIDLLGGSISFTSAEGKGTTFTVVIP